MYKSGQLFNPWNGSEENFDRFDNYHFVDVIGGVVYLEEIEIISTTALLKSVGNTKVNHGVQIFAVISHQAINS